MNQINNVLQKVNSIFDVLIKMRLLGQIINIHNLIIGIIY